MSLAPCTSCRRHVYRDAPACPFCGGVVGSPRVPRIVARATRAAVLFAGVVVLGCSDDGGSVPEYGAPMPSDTGRVDSGEPDVAAFDSGVADSGAADSGADGD